MAELQKLPNELSDLIKKVNSQTENPWFPLHDFIVDKNNNDQLYYLWHYMIGSKIFEQACSVEYENTGRFDGNRKPVYREVQTPFSLGKGILLMGNPGTGKDAMMMLMARWFSENRREMKFRWTHISEAADEIKNRTIDYFKEIGVYDYYFADIGIHDMEKVNSFGNKFIVTENIITWRYESFTAPLSNHLTHFTTNLTYIELEQLLSNRIMSRLRQMCNFISLDGPDRRKNSMPRNLRVATPDVNHDSPSRDRILQSLEQLWLITGQMPQAWNYTDMVNHLVEKGRLVLTEEIKKEAMVKAEVQQKADANKEIDGKAQALMLDLLKSTMHMADIQNKYILLQYFMNKNGSEPVNK